MDHQAQFHRFHGFGVLSVRGRNCFLHNHAQAKGSPYLKDGQPNTGCTGRSLCSLR
jgi:hypothetical protein